MITSRLLFRILALIVACYLLSVSPVQALPTERMTSAINDALSLQLLNNEEVPRNVGHAEFIQRNSSSRFGQDTDRIDAHARFLSEISAVDAPLSLLATSPTYQWHTFYGSSTGDYRDDSGIDVAVDGAGNVYVVGMSNGNWLGPNGKQPLHAFSGKQNQVYAYTDLMVLKLDRYGAYQWHTFYGTQNGYDVGIDIALDANSNIYVTGASDSAWQGDGNTSPKHGFNGGHDIVVLKLNSDGKYQWHTFYGSQSNICCSDIGNGIAVDKGGNVYIIGASQEEWQGDNNANPLHSSNGGIALLSLSNQGQYRWHTFYSSSTSAASGYAISVDSSSNIYFTGYSGSTWQGDNNANPLHAYSGTNPNFAVGKLTSTGAYQWHTFYGANEVGGTGITVDSSNGVYIVGTSNATWQGDNNANPLHAYSGGSDIAITKLSSSGSYQWHSFYGESNRGSGIVTDSSNNIYVTGGSASTWQGDNNASPLHGFSGSGNNIVVLSLNGDGGYRWHTFYGANDDRGSGIGADSQGNIYVTGSSSDAWQGDNGVLPLHPPDEGPTGNYDLVAMKIATKRTIVFVHGINLKLSSYQSCNWPEPDGYFNQIDDKLRHYYIVRYAELATSACATDSLEQNALRLANAIQQAKHETGQSKVILVTHSMGGLVARAYIEGQDYANDVSELFTFGSPHLGIPQDVIAFLAFGARLGIFCQVQAGLCDMSMYNMVLFNVTHRPPSGVTYHLITGSTPIFQRSLQGLITGRLIPLEDDGIVPVFSGVGLPGTMNRFITNEAHNTDLGSPSYFYRKDGQPDSYTHCLYRVLVGDASDCGDQVVAQNEIPYNVDSVPRTPFEHGTLLSGQSVTRILAAEGTDLLFAAGWQTGTVTLHLISPVGEIVDPTYASTHPQQVTYLSDQFGATYHFTDTLTGMWKMVIHAIDSPPEGTLYTTFAAFDSSIRLLAGTDKYQYTPYSTAIITASILPPTANALITATVLYANDSVDILSLPSVGAGQYEISYTVPNTLGYVEIRLNATGNTLDGIEIERGTEILVQTVPSQFIFNGSFADEPQRLPLSPSYNGLTVTVGVDADVSGTVSLSGELFDEFGNFVARSVTTSGITTGTNEIELFFLGADIYDSRRDGPYILTNLLLTDKNAELVADKGEDIHTTETYHYWQFASPQIFLPLLER